MTEQDTHNTPNRTILQVLPALETGGVERGTVDMVRAIVDAGDRAIVISSGGPLVHDVERAGGIHIAMPVHSKNPFSIGSNRRALMRIIKQYNVDIVHARSRAPAWPAYQAAKRCGVPFITTFHGTYNFKTALKRWYNSIMVRGEVVIVASDFIRRHVMDNYGVDESKIRHIPRGVDINIFDPNKIHADRLGATMTEWNIQDGQKIVLLPGRLTRWKGHQLLLEAMSYLDIGAIGGQYPVCVFLGSDQGRIAYTEQLRKQARDLGLTDYVCIPGGTRNMSAAYKTADVIVSASVEPEAFGRVSAEGQAMGRPVVAPNHGAAPEIVIDNETGWLFKPGDAKSLADALQKALQMSVSARTQMASNSVRHIRENFTNDHMTSATLATYDEVIKNFHKQ